MEIGDYPDGFQVAGAICEEVCTDYVVESCGYVLRQSFRLWDGLPNRGFGTKLMLGAGVLLCLSVSVLCWDCMLKELSLIWMLICGSMAGTGYFLDRYVSFEGRAAEIGYMV